MLNINRADKSNRIGIIFILILFLFIFIFLAGCNNTPDPLSPEIENTLPSGYVIIEKGNQLTKDCTPVLEIVVENAEYMAFSGNGSHWSSWIPYSHYYDDFNIADGTCGTTMNSGAKTIYVRFKDQSGNMFPDGSTEAIFATIQYEMQEFFSIKIEPKEVEIKTGESITLKVRGYDLYLNEVPLPVNQIVWSKPCMVGTLNPTLGLKTVYTAPDIPGLRNITANYGTLSTGAKVYVIP